MSGWKVVEGRRNPRAEKKARKATNITSFTNGTGAFAELEEFRRNAEEDKRQRQEEEAELRRQREVEEKEKKKVAEERKKRRDAAERARKAKDPKCWSVISDVLNQNKNAMLEDILALEDDELATSSVAMTVQYVFTTLDKHCRSATLPSCEQGSTERYFEPLRGVQDDEECYASVQEALDAHFYHLIDEEEFLAAAATTFGPRGTTNFFDQKNPTGLGLLLAFQYLVEWNKEAALQSFPRMLSTIFVHEKTGDFNSPVALRNACAVLAMCIDAEKGDAEKSVRSRAITSLFAHCFYASGLKVDSEFVQLLKFFSTALKNARQNLDGEGASEAAVADVTAAYQFIVKLAEAGLDQSTLFEFVREVSRVNQRQKAFRNSFLVLLKELEDSSAKNRQASASLARDICYFFVVSDDENGKVQGIWAESIANHIPATVSLLTAIRQADGALHPSFAEKATGKLKKAQLKGAAQADEALSLLIGSKTGINANAHISQRMKSGASVAQVGQQAAEKRATEAPQDSDRRSNTPLQTFTAIVVLVAFAFSVITKKSA